MSNAFNRSMNVMLENKKLIIQAVLSVAYYVLLFYLLRLLFFYRLEATQKDIVMIIVGALVSCFTQVTGFWFHVDKDESKEPPSEPAAEK